MARDRDGEWQGDHRGKEQAHWFPPVFFWHRLLVSHFAGVWP